jgi:AcrR family transcriptional regulator
MSTVDKPVSTAEKPADRALGAPGPSALPDAPEPTPAALPDAPEPTPAALLNSSEPHPGPPKRADARRNYEKVVAAARDAFAEDGASTSLEAIARRAGVGIGTLYRHFPTRQVLLEAVYTHEVEVLCRTAAEFDDRDAWEAFEGWLRQFVSYMATKHALVAELFDYVDRDAPLFKGCRTSIFAAGEPLLRRAQEAGAVRRDVELGDIIQMVGGIAKIQASEPGQIDHILRIALDGLRYSER